MNASLTTQAARAAVAHGDATLEEAAHAEAAAKAQRVMLQADLPTGFNYGPVTLEEAVRAQTAPSPQLTPVNLPTVYYDPKTSTEYRALSPGERKVFVRVFDELTNNLSNAFLFTAEQAGAGQSPTAVDPVAAKKAQIDEACLFLMSSILMGGIGDPVLQQVHSAERIESEGPAIGVRLKGPRGPTYEELCDRVAKAVTDLLAANGYGDIVDPHHPSNDVIVTHEKGGFRA